MGTYSGLGQVCSSSQGPPLGHPKGPEVTKSNLGKTIEKRKDLQQSGAPPDKGLPSASKCSQGVYLRNGGVESTVFKERRAYRALL